MAFDCSCLFRDSLHHKMRWQKKQGQTPHRMSIHVLWFRDKDNVMGNAIEPMTKLTILNSTNTDMHVITNNRKNVNEFCFQFDSEESVSESPKRAKGLWCSNLDLTVVFSFPFSFF